MEQVWRMVERYQMLEAGDRVLVGVSGGPDSVALLDLLYSARSRYGIELFVAHVDHQLRPEAEEEARYVEALSARLGLPFRCFRVDVARLAAERGISLEEAGHTARFACFAEAAAAWQTNKLALGHHRDDRAESVLLHLIRGCGPDGLAAMPPREGAIIRPLAGVDKAQLAHYCQERQLRYFVDASNLEPCCLRNRVRLELLPCLRAYNPGIVDALLRLSECSADDAACLAARTEELWRAHGSVRGGEARLDARALDGLPTALARRLLRRLYRAAAGDERDLSFAQVEAMRALAAGRGGTRSLSLADGLVFLRCYDCLSVARADARTDGAARARALEAGLSWKLDTPLALPDGAVLSARVFPRDSQTETERLGRIGAEHGLWQVAADADCLAEILTVRGRRPGDVVQPLGMQGHKKLKAYLIDRKVPRETRDQLPLVLSGEEIVWIPGCFLSERVRVTDATERVCLLRCRRAGEA